jgi:Kef-type K+ transport system membrane component KefB
MHLLDTMAILATALIAAKLLGGILARFGIPTVISELGIGILIGNMSGFFGESIQSLNTAPIVQGLSELGVLFLLFAVGLETNLKEMMKTGSDAARVAVTGVIAPVTLAFILLPLAGPSNFQHTLFIAAALSATSVGITARVLKDAGRIGSASGQIILGAAVIDDVLGIILLALVAAIATTGSISGTAITILLAKIIGFAILMGLTRKFLFPHFFMRIKPLEVSGTVITLLLALCLLTAWGSEKAGLAGIVGAFALGIVLEDIHFHGFKDVGDVKLAHLMKPLTDFLAPIFFIVMGLGVNLKSLLSPSSAMLATILIVAGIIGKLAAGFVISKKAKKLGSDKWLIGLGMMPRGEVGLIFAVMGRKLGALGDADYAAVVSMVTVTTLIAPFAISWRASRIPN